MERAFVHCDYQHREEPEHKASLACLCIQLCAGIHCDTMLSQSPSGSSLLDSYNGAVAVRCMNSSMCLRISRLAI